jgi:uncharacterized protein
VTTGRLTPLAGLLCLTASATVLAINAPQPDAPPPIRAVPQAQRILSSNWEKLLPSNERDHFSLVPPPPLHDYLSQTAAASQSGSAQVNRALEGTTIELTGFIVPLELEPSGSIIEFFLVPYVGACIHVPPPAPNQMVYVHMDKSLPLQPLYEPYTVTGRLHAHPRGSDLGSAAYSMDVGHIEHYGS